KFSSSLRPCCSDKCGEVEISYPFGIGNGCFLQGFEIVCNQNIPYLAGTDLQLLEIFSGEVQVNSSPFIYTGCLMDKGELQKISLPPDGPYKFSTKNKYTVVGCNVLGTIVSQDLNHPWGGNICSSFCHTRENMDRGYCTGKGCCQTILADVPKALGFSTFSLSRPNITLCESDVWELKRTRNFTLRLDWSVGKEYCSMSLENKYTCGNNSHCEQPTKDVGYLCKCFSGYDGNPYLNDSQGCQYINNCTSMENSPCVPEATCDKTDSDMVNKDYTCVCPVGTLGDGLKIGDGCKAHSSQANHPIYRASMLAVAVISCLALLYWVQIKRHLAKLRSKHFHQNGGLLLQQHDNTRKGRVTSNKHVMVFSAQELEKATDNYHRSRVLGHGAQGTVYKGLQKSQSVNMNRVEQFINEVIMLTEINHKNIVKLIGCCLETQVPLVYEFITGGTLYEKLHKNDEKSIQLSWKGRLQIAIEVGEALSYLHSYISMPIFQRDIKSSNILLDETNTAKLADFGLSKLIPSNNGRTSTVVQGTIGYIDPEYFISGMLTEKSDVYSFGVVLLELLTGRKPVRHEDTRDYSSLVMHFQSYSVRDNFFQILDERILQAQTMDQMKFVARIASGCLNGIGIERPSMKEVVRELLSVPSEIQRSPHL
ncbi:hypothetical protein AQUCO_02500340v1, partial [Aquilegia coerulea]